MAPDKIYLCADAPRIYDWSNEPFEKGGNVEYIRKDALLGWAKDNKVETEDVIKQHPEDESLWAEMHWWEVVIAKINAM